MKPQQKRSREQYWFMPVCVLACVIICHQPLLQNLITAFAGNTTYFRGRRECHSQNESVPIIFMVSIFIFSRVEVVIPKNVKPLFKSIALMVIIKIRKLQ